MAAYKTLMTMPEGIREATVRLSKKYAYNFILGRIKELQDGYEGVGEFRFAPNEENKGKVWDSFDNLIADADAHETKVTHPVTISTEAAYAIIIPFIELSNVLNRVSKLPEGSPIAAMIDAAVPGSEIIAAIHGICQHMAPLIKTDIMSRDGDSVKEFRVKLEALVSKGQLGTKNCDAVVRLFVSYLKVIAWMAGNSVWETKKFTLNYEQMLLVMANLRMCLPGNGCVDSLINEVKEQVHSVQERAIAEKKIAAEKAAAAKKVAAGKKTAAAKKAATVAADDTAAPEKIPAASTRVPAASTRVPATSTAPAKTPAAPAKAPAKTSATPAKTPAAPAASAKTLKVTAAAAADASPIAETDSDQDAEAKVDDDLDGMNIMDVIELNEEETGDAKTDADTSNLRRTVAKKPGTDLDYDVLLDQLESHA